MQISLTVVKSIRTLFKLILLSFYSCLDNFPCFWLTDGFQVCDCPSLPGTKPESDLSVNGVYKSSIMSLHWWCSLSYSYRILALHTSHILIDINYLLNRLFITIWTCVHSTGFISLLQMAYFFLTLILFTVFIHLIFETTFEFPRQLYCIYICKIKQYCLWTESLICTLHNNNDYVFFLSIN